MIQVLIKELANRVGGDDLTKREGGEEMVKRIFKEMVNRKILHFH